MPRTAHYLSAVKADLPEAAFRPSPRKLAKASLHVAVAVAGWIAIGTLPMAYWPLASAAIGVSLGAIAFLAHDAIHGTIVRQPRGRAVTEIALWSLILMPRTVYRRVHHWHHRGTNSEQDPDRRFLPEELTGATSAFGPMYFPSRQWLYAALWPLHFVGYSIRHTSAAFAADPRRQAFVTAAPRYSPRERLAIRLELGIIALLQVAVWFIATRGHHHHRLLAYALAMPVPVILMSAVVSFYFFTNHGLKPLSDDADVLAGTTSIAVPRVFDWLHSNFSYHAEHHLFPAMNADYYPLVSDLLRREFPDRYDRRSAASAWAALLRSDVAARRQNWAAPLNRRPQT